MSKKWKSYRNGNARCKINLEDGTMVMKTRSREFELEFPVNIDMNISNKCEIGCSFCYQGSSRCGEQSDIRSYIENKKSFLWTLKPWTEVAINGNEPLHPELEELLVFLKSRKIVANLTVNEFTLVGSGKGKIERWMAEGLVHGVGVSPCEYSQDMLRFAGEHGNVVVHTIAGITSGKQYAKLINSGLKVLVLGYKTTGRGGNAYEKNKKEIEAKQRELRQLLGVLGEAGAGARISFDNLAIEQLNPKEIMGISDEEYERSFRGEDGRITMFVDLVQGTFSKNSVDPRRIRIAEDIKKMFEIVKKMK